MSDKFSSGVITAKGFKNDKILKLDTGSVLVPFYTHELDLIINEFNKRIKLLEDSGDYPERNDDHLLLERLKDALYYSEFKVCSKCGVIYYTTHPSSEKCRGV